MIHTGIRGEGKVTEVTDKDLYGALAAVMHGFDPVAAHNLVRYFHDCLQDGRPYNEQILLDYVYHAFGKIINEKVSADHAFGFKQSRGKYQREDATERDVVAAALVMLHMRNKKSYLEAKGDSANALFPDGEGEKAVEAAYSQYKSVLQYMSTEALKELTDKSLRS